MLPAESKTATPGVEGRTHGEDPAFLTVTSAPRLPAAPPQPVLVAATAALPHASTATGGADAGSVPGVGSRLSELPARTEGTELAGGDVGSVALVGAAVAEALGVGARLGVGAGVGSGLTAPVQAPATRAMSTASPKRRIRATAPGG